jgi:hypothetical protein
MMCRRERRRLPLLLVACCGEEGLLQRTDGTVGSGSLSLGGTQTRVVSAEPQRLYRCYFHCCSLRRHRKSLPAVLKTHKMALTSCDSKWRNELTYRMKRRKKEMMKRAKSLQREFVQYFNRFQAEF